MDSDPLKYPESIKMLPDDIIMMTWGYDVQDSYSKMIEPFKNAGFEFTISPGVLNSSNVMPNYNITMPNIHNSCKRWNQVWLDGNGLYSLG